MNIQLLNTGVTLWIHPQILEVLAIVVMFTLLCTLVDSKINRGTNA